MIFPRVERGTGCGDFLVTGFYYKPTKNKIQEIKMRTTSEEWKAGDGSGRFYYAILGPDSIQQGWDTALESIGFRCIRKVLNSAHHNGKPMKFYLKVG